MVDPPRDSLAIDRDAREARLDGVPIHLTNAEYTLLVTLADSPRRALSTSYLTQVILESEWVTETHALQVYVSRLRRKIGESGTAPRRVITVHGYGYRYEPDKAPALSQMLAPDERVLREEMSLLSAFILTDFNRTILWASDSITPLLGWQPSEVRDRMVYELIHPDDLPQTIASRLDTDAGIASAMLLRLLTASGDYRLMEALVRPILCPEDSMIAFLGEFRLATSHEPRPLANTEFIRFTSPH